MLKNGDVTNLKLENYKRQNMHTSSTLPTAPCSVDLTIKEHIIAYMLYCVQIKANAEDTVGKVRLVYKSTV